MRVFPVQPECLGVILRALGSFRQCTAGLREFLSQLFLFSQLESTLREKSQQLESLQEMKISLEEQLKKETAAKVVFSLVI